MLAAVCRRGRGDFAKFLKKKAAVGTGARERTMPIMFGREDKGRDPVGCATERASAGEKYIFMEAEGLEVLMVEFKVVPAVAAAAAAALEACREAPVLRA